MNKARLAILGIAVLAGGGAALLMSGGDSPPPAEPVAAAPSKTVDVLVAALEMPMGQSIKQSDLRWQPWPVDSAGAAVIKRTEAPRAMEEVAGSLARSAFLEGEPIRREKLIKTDGTGFMSAILPSGMR